MLCILVGELFPHAAAYDIAGEIHYDDGDMILRNINPDSVGSVKNAADHPGPAPSRGLKYAVRGDQIPSLQIRKILNDRRNAQSGLQRDLLPGYTAALVYAAINIIPINLSEFDLAGHRITLRRDLYVPPEKSETLFRAILPCHNLPTFIKVKIL